MKECKALGMLGAYCSKTDGVCLLLDDFNQQNRVGGLPTREEISRIYAGCECLSEVLKERDELEKEKS